MTRKADFSLDQAILDPGFTPSQKDVEPLLDRLMRAGGDEAEAHLFRALLRLGAKAALPALARAKSAEGHGLRRLVRLLGQLERSESVPSVLEFLVEELAHQDPKIRSLAVQALGKLRGPRSEDALIAALAKESEASVRRALVQALGYVGGERARMAISSVQVGDGLLEQRKQRASLMLERDRLRVESSVFDAAKPSPAPVPIALRCRSGMEDFLCDELGPNLKPRVSRKLPLGLRVEALLSGAPLQLFRARLWTSFGFLLTPRAASSPDELAARVIDALSSDEAFGIFKHWTRGPLRYRLAWPGGGKRRALVYRVAAEVSARRPQLHNDPRESPWQAVVHEGGGAVCVELVPRLSDPRFAYRAGDVPAASHPSIAALIARVSGVRDDDVVWDPFVGSGLELCERSLRGPYRMLLGSDRDKAALQIARVNLENAQARHFKLFEHDIRDPLPAFEARPTLVLSNPPMGLRVHRSTSLPEVLDAFLLRAAEALCPGGRLTWISPMPERTASTARRAGLALVLSKPVDMGGFEAQLQAFTKAVRG